MIPRATYRLQFHQGFTFADAAAHAGYFADLGISHIYTSPILKARAGSLHGYDVIDHSQINPELGGEDAFVAMAAAFARLDLGLIVDIVPNHVAVGHADNPWWQDLLAKGPRSRFAGAFDLDWDVPGLEGKVFVPFLAEPPAAALARGDLKLVRQEGVLCFGYYEHRFPLRPQDQGLVGHEALSQSALLELLDRQNFVLADWRQADARINWRRFFDINDLAAIRIAEPEVLKSVHAKIFALYARGLIDGVRIDHVDGLADPRAYCRTLRHRLEALRPGSYLVVEKILAEAECLPQDWLVDGTTGYDFLNEVSALLHAPDGGRLEALWHATSGRAGDFEAEETLARDEVLRSKFASQRMATARAFARILQSPVEPIAQALAAIIVRLRCYRSYATAKPDSPGPGALLAAAIARAQQETGALTPMIGQIAGLFSRSDGDPLVVDALRRFSQLCASVAAKAVEDTAFYRYGRLLSRNDVGCNPGHHRMTVEAFHSRMRRRAALGPNAMLTTATHDHKRGEDARMRLACLSHHPLAWQLFADRPSPPGLDRGDVYQLYQTLFSAWPAHADESFAGRVQGWCDKFLRESKLRSSWTAPNSDYEARFRNFARSLILAPAQAEFRGDLAKLLEELKATIAVTGIAQTVLRNTLPGLADLFQGCEFEDLSLVDPDNRRAVDFCARKRALRGHRSIKQQVLANLLRARKADPLLWEKGDYQPLALEQSCLGFSRQYGASRLVVVLRCNSQSALRGEIPLDGQYRDVLSGKNWSAEPARLADIFAVFPAAVLLRGATSQ